ncbi:MAG TPA: PaaI family thioesterase [Desulfobacteraceae bacterium]|nr:PaaI family thioesterase [Desulfobacteraceae bacterium]HPQ29342.1 PaaI family thioesterase [Desulfobacteraceae bacterium]
MTDKEHYKKLEQMYAFASCNEYYSPELTVSEGTAELIIPVQKKFFHAAGATHGAVYFKALDDAAFFACNSMVKDFLVLTVDFNVYLFRPISSGHMRAVGRVVYNSRNMLIGESQLFDSKEREIARGSGTFAKSKIRLSPELGYVVPDIKD